MPGLEGLVKYWYHFAIMFEALFILTTIDTGTRIGRFLVQEFLGKLWKPLGDLDWLPGVDAGDGAGRRSAGRYFIWTGSVETIWPMFGMANQLLAVIALAVVTTVLVNSGRAGTPPVTLVPDAVRGDDDDARPAICEITGKFYTMIRTRPGAAGLAQYRPDGDAAGVRGGDPGGCGAAVLPGDVEPQAGGGGGGLRDHRARRAVAEGAGEPLGEGEAARSIEVGQVAEGIIGHGGEEVENGRGRGAEGPAQDLLGRREELRGHGDTAALGLGEKRDHDLRPGAPKLADQPHEVARTFWLSDE